METADRISIGRIKEAITKIDPLFLNSPQYFCQPLSDVLQCRVILKDETKNPVGSFKGRGADFLGSGFANESGIVCASAGNFGQALGYACKKKNIRLTVFASVNANRLKVDRIRSFGAKVILRGEDFDESKIEAKAYSKKIGARFVEDSLDIETVEGAGTIGLELLNLPEKLDYLLIALGNGALLTGVAKVFKQYSPYTKIVAVQAKDAPAMIASWRKGELVTSEKSDTIADGIAVRLPIPQVLDDMRGIVDEGF